MLSREENEQLTQVGRGTPMGELLRRYWYPVAASSELIEKPTKAVRVLGEDLVLYRDKDGRPGLSARNARTGACRWFWAFRKSKACAVRITAGCTTGAENVSNNLTNRPRTR